MTLEWSTIHQGALALVVFFAVIIVMCVLEMTLDISGRIERARKAHEEHEQNERKDSK